MKDLVKVNYGNGRPTVLGRDLHKVLKVKTAYKDWFPRMCEYGFIEGKDFNPLKNEQVQKEGKRDVKREITDHQLTIQMAKELCMIQRSEMGKKCREYFIAIEEEWNSPESVLSRALGIAEAKLDEITNRSKRLEETVNVQSQQISELMPKAGYYDTVLNCTSLVSVSTIAKDFGWSAKKLNSYLHEKGVQYKQGDIWFLMQEYAENGYTSTKTHIYNGDDGPKTKVHTYWTQKGRLFIYDLLKHDGILPLIEKKRG